MASSIINSDDGVVSGTSGLKTTGGDDGVTAFQQNGTERMRIDSSGRVLIGQTSGNYPLEVTGSNGNGIKFTESSNNVQCIMAGFNSTALFGTITNHPMLFWVNNGERVRITSDGYLRMASGSGGIQFNGDTAAANALDDYEEGTFTPTLVSGFSTAPTGYSSQAGRYTKIGRVVNFEVEINPNGAVANGNHWIIGGLPFTVVSGPPFSGAYVIYQVNADTNAGDTWVAQQGTTQLECYANGGGSRVGNAAGININERIILAGFYTVA